MLNIGANSLLSYRPSLSERGTGEINKKNTRPTHVYSFNYHSTGRNISVISGNSYRHLDLNVDYNSKDDLYIIHSNFEGQVNIDGKEQINIDLNAPPQDENDASIKAKGAVRFSIRRFSRSWWLDENGLSIHEAQIKPDSDLGSNAYGWVFDSTQPQRDWVDLAGMSPVKLSNWNMLEHRGIFDEFLIGVVDNDNILGRHNAYINKSDIAKKCEDYFSKGKIDEFILEEAGIPKFKYRYVAYAIERKSFIGHPFVFRMKYLESNRTFGIKEYINIYKNLEPKDKIFWDSMTTWKELEIRGDSCNVVDCTKTSHFPKEYNSVPRFKQKK